MNKVRILFFATLHDYVGSKSLEIEIPEGMTIEELTTMLTKAYPRLGKGKRSIMAAINREYAANEQIIPQDAEIALFPPVSGG
jgi:molybdopterin converting factor subunit 1